MIHKWLLKKKMLNVTYQKHPNQDHTEVLPYMDQDVHYQNPQKSSQMLSSRCESLEPWHLLVWKANTKSLMSSKIP